MLSRVTVIVAFAVLLPACASEAEPSTTTTTEQAATTTTDTSPSTTTTVTSLQPCTPPPFVPVVLPNRSIDRDPSPSDVPLDLYTLQPGTIVRSWADQDGNPVLAVVRGALPPVRWTETPERIEIRGVEAALGPLPDGVWAAAWSEGPERCDLYTIVFYPPVDPEEARAVAQSVTGDN